MLVSYINYSRILESHLEDDSERDRVFQEKPCCQLYLKLSPAIDCERDQDVKLKPSSQLYLELSPVVDCQRDQDVKVKPSSQLYRIEPCSWLPERSRCESKTIFWLRKHKKDKKVLKGPSCHGLQVIEERLCNCCFSLMNSEETKHSHIYSICFCLESLTLPYERNT